jgi:hypothetical protein
MEDSEVWAKVINLGQSDEWRVSTKEDELVAYGKK